MLRPGFDSRLLHMEKMGVSKTRNEDFYFVAYFNGEEYFFVEEDTDYELNKGLKEDEVPTEAAIRLASSFIINSTNNVASKIVLPNKKGE